MKPRDQMQSLIQDCLKKLPVIVLGSGASVPHGIPGMWPLGQHLSTSTLPSDCAGQADIEGWSEFLKKISIQDLESALTGVTVTEPVLRHIIKTTWNFLNAADFQVFEKVLAERNSLPLTQLFQYLFRSTAQELHVVTPNYDRIAEYAAEAAGFCAYAGFNFGIFGDRASNPPPRISVGKRQIRTVNVWKVHGSFGWFTDDRGGILSLPPLQSIPAGLTPVIVTPGTEKYRRTHEEPFRSSMHNADDAMQKANSFLCIGYGFNDPHLQHLLVQRCSAPDVPLVLITKTVSDTAREFLKSGKCVRYAALEESSGGVRLFSNELPDGIEIPGDPFWQLQHFLTLVT